MRFAHTIVFTHPLFKETFPNLFFNVLTVIAATASELETPTQQPKPIGPSGKPSRKPLQS